MIARWEAIPRLALIAVGGLLIGCLNSAPTPGSPDSTLGGTAARFAQPAIEQGSGLTTTLTGRAGRIIKIGPRPANEFAQAPSATEIRAGRFMSAQMLEPTQPLVPVSGVTIRIGFDRPVDPATVGKSFKIQPAVPGHLEWQEPKTVAYVLDKLAYATTYTVDLEAAGAGDRLTVGWQWVFTTIKPITISIDDCASTAGELRNVLAVLAQKHVHAIMFPTGVCNSTYPWFVPQMLAEGHTVCNHTYSHPRDLTKLTDAQITTEIKTGVHANCNLFRPPWGAWDGPGGRVDRIANSLGYKVYMWDVDTLDWAGANTPQMLKSIYSTGGVILMHFHGKYTVETIRQLQL